MKRILAIAHMWGVVAGVMYTLVWIAALGFFDGSYYLAFLHAAFVFLLLEYKTVKHALKREELT